MAAGENSLGYAGWRVAAAASFSLSFAASVPYVFPLFLKPLSDEFGWSREAISYAHGIHSLLIAACATPVGFMADRWGPTRLVPAALLLFGAVFASLALLTPAVWHLYLVFALLGAAITGLLPVAYARTVASWFDRRRGLALAVAISGGSIGGLILPPVAQFLLQAVGWRATFLSLGAAAIVFGAPVAFFGIREPSSGRSASPSPRQGAGVAEALATRVFWTITVAFFCSTMIQYGAVTHLAALLTDRGVSTSQAAMAVSVFGGASLIGRLLAGTLLDRFFAARVAFGLLLAASLGALLLAQATSVAVAVVATFLVGLGTAGESDVVPYMLTRYFGLRSSSTIYGVAWLATSIGAAAGPVLMGRTFDATASYEMALFAVAGLVAAAAALMLTMPRPVAARGLPQAVTL